MTEYSMKNLINLPFLSKFLLLEMLNYFSMSSSDHSAQTCKSYTFQFFFGGPLGNSSSAGKFVGKYSYVNSLWHFTVLILKIIS